MNAKKSTLAKQEDLPRRGSKSMIGIYDSPVPRPPPYLSTPIRPATTRFGTKYSLHWYARRVKEAIHIRLHPDNVNMDNGIEIPDAWIPTIKKHNRRPVHQRTAEGTTSNRTSRETTSQRNNKDRNAPITADHRDSYGDAQAVDLIA